MGKGEPTVARSEILRKTQDNAIVRYFRETWYELKKVSWPTRREAANLTLIVIAVTIFMSIVLGLMDWLFQTGLALILKATGAG
jgi:preprotein translocase subunit SecE